MGDRIKLYEIAALAGVSVSTVSRVLSHDTRKPASKATAERVQQAAAQLGYYGGAAPETVVQPNRQILCILSGQAYTYSDYVYAEIMRGIQMELQKYNCRLAQMLSAVGIDESIRALETECSRYSGIILLGRISQEKIRFLHTLTRNIVYAGLNPLDFPMDQVVCNSYHAIRDIMDYLIGIGHRRIAFLGVIPKKNGPVINESRFDAYRDSLKHHGLPLEPELCLNVELTAECAYEAIERFLASGLRLPDAIICSTDSCAVATISALKRNGIRIPEDISVAGHDGVELSSFIEPQLTTVNMQKYDLGRFAAILLNDRMDGKHTDPVRIELPHHLSIQQSCRKLTD